MDAKSTNNLERLDSLQEKLDRKMAKQRNSECLPTSKQQVGKTLRSERRIIENRLAECIGRLESQAAEIRIGAIYQQQLANYSRTGNLLTEQRNIEEASIPRNPEENQPSTSKARPTTSNIPD